MTFTVRPGRVTGSEATVKTHVGHIMAKLGLRDGGRRLPYETGLIAPGAAGKPQAAGKPHGRPTAVSKRQAGVRPRSPRCAGSTLTRLCAAITR